MMMVIDEGKDGRVPDGTGLSQVEPASGLAPSGFDPSRKVLASLIAEVDAAWAACPVNRSRIFLDVCPKCGATDSERCSLAVAAADGVVAGVRELLAGDSDGSPKGGDAEGGSVACDDSAGRKASPEPSQSGPSL